MKAEFFKAVCPLEIGDTVAIRLAEKGCTRSQILQHFTI